MIGAIARRRGVLTFHGPAWSMEAPGEGMIGEGVGTAPNGTFLLDLSWHLEPRTVPENAVEGIRRWSSLPPRGFPIRALGRVTLSVALKFGCRRVLG